jgi:DNA repair protein RecN (Recombination protein N)
MIKSLTIRNYALIDELSVEFSSGLVILTGETGAGKSIIIDALGMIIGERASTEVVRTNADKAIVEGAFDVTDNTKLAALLEENELEVQPELIARREISARGQTRCFINDSPVSLAFLRQVGDLLVDLHGQHEHQSLLRAETHIGMLDDFGGLGSIVDTYRGSYRRYLELREKRNELARQEQSLREKQEFIRFQLKEIDEVNPEEGEEERIEQELKILENGEELFGATSRLYAMLYEGEQSVHDMLVVARNQLQNLAAIDRQFQEQAAECGSAVAIVSELAKFVQHYNAAIEFSPERLEELRNRIGRLSLLKKKYGGSLEHVMQYRKDIGSQFDLAENFSTVLATVSKDLDDARTECVRVAERLSTKRAASARKLETSLKAELTKLGIQHPRFSVRLERTMEGGGDGSEFGLEPGARESVRLHDRGCDNVEFYISTNPGEEERPLARVASGGEISRIMLALKSILAKSDRLPVLIFDEIDVGVSGRIAQTVGKSLSALSQFHQVIAITHLPQIAGLADQHFSVSKKVAGERTTTALRKLTLDERIHEVAKLMSGAEVTEAGMAGARELMGLQ